MPTPSTTGTKSTSNPLASRLRAELHALGQVPAVMALHLEALGYRGRQCDAEGCPLAHYLEARLGGRASVSAARIIWWPDPTDDTYTSVVPPFAVAAFIEAFDFGVLAGALAVAS